jgi:hypothetical protein
MKNASVQDIAPVASSVSQALKAINAEFDSPGQLKLWNRERTAYQFLMRVANDRLSRERAYRLAHCVYKNSGYVDDAGLPMIVGPYDANPGTLTLIEEDRSGAAVGSVSLFFDSEAGLPCDEIYRTELSKLRGEGRQLAEVTRLVIAPEQQHCRDLLVSLCNFVMIYAVHVRKFTDFVIEVNPRHVAFYRRLLKFEIAGPERPCPRVKGAPAVLLRLDLSVYQRQVEYWSQPANRTMRPNEKSLYSQYAPIDREAAIASFMATQHKSMTYEDARYFWRAQAAAPATR